MTRWEIRLWGLGGQGIITAGHIIGEAASLRDKKDAVMTEDYSPYVTGGWSRADVVIASEAIDFPLVTRPDVLVAMSQDGLDSCWQAVKEGGLILTEGNIVNADKVEGRRVLSVPAVTIAEELGRRVVANIVMLGAFASAAGVVTADALKWAISKRFPKAVDLNMKAFDRGYEFGLGGR